MFIGKKWLLIFLFSLTITGDRQLPHSTKNRMAETKKWVVTLSDQRPTSEVAQELTQNGFTIDQVLDEINCVTGTASEEVAKKLRTLPGITDVSPEAGIDIGPPDADPTW